MKIGKSEFCAQSPKTLILDFENGYNMHFGVLKLNVSKWSEVKMIVRQLERPEAHEKYNNIAFDTLNEAWDACTEFICAQSGVQKIGDLPYGQGYRDRDQEFTRTLTKILNNGYGLLTPCHTKEVVIGQKDGVDIVKLVPDLDKRCLSIINGLVDIMSMIVKSWNEETNQWDRWLLTQATPTISAGTRLKYLEPKIPFGYDYLEQAVSKAIEKAQDDGAIITEEDLNDRIEVLDFNKIRNEALELWNKLVLKDPNSPDEEMAKRILKRVEIAFGHPMKLSEITEDQVDIFNLVLEDMKDLAS